MVLGLAIYNSVILDLHFPTVVYKKLLGQSLTIEDIKEIEPEVYKSLKDLLSFDGDVEEIFCLTFQIQYEAFDGQKHTVNLKVRSKKAFG